MTLDEAIKCTEKLAKEFKLDVEISITKYAKENLNRLADEYEQIAEWLTELKNRREVSEIEKRSIEKRDKMLRDTVAELCEAKRLLKAAVEDLRVLIEGTDTCEYCKWFDTETTECNFSDKDASCKDIVGWKHEGESLKLIGGEK